MAMTPAKVEVFACNSNLQIVSEVRDYLSLTANKVLNDVGSWELSLSGASKSAKWFDPAVNPGGGILIRRNGVQFLAGPGGADGEEWSDDSGQNEVLTFNGSDHNLWLFGRDIYPNPAQTIATMDKQLYKITDEAAVEDLMIHLVRVNLGDLALVPRRLAHLVMATSLHRGTIRQSSPYRFDKLGEALQTLCNDAVIEDDPDPEFTRLSFDLIQNNSGQVVFTVGQTDKSSLVKFSKELKTLRSYQRTRTRATATNIVLGAGLEELKDDLGNPIPGAARFARGLFEYTRTDTTYPGRLEDFVDQGLLDPSTDDFDTDYERQQAQLALDKAAADAFASAQGQVGVTIVPRETYAQQFGRDYQLGDFCTVILPRQTVVEQIREVELSLQAGDAEQLTISVGTVNGDYQRRSPGVYRRLTTLKDYMNRLKREK